MSAPLRIHHLDCGTMCPHALVPLGLAARDPGHLVAHCLLIEAPDGLVLVDTGYGAGDVADPRRLGPARHLLGARLDPEQTAAARIRRLGLDPADVRHVVPTHLDLDHAGGLGDFPDATVHVHADELAAAQARRGDTRLRYRPAQWAHGPRWSCGLRAYHRLNSADHGLLTANAARLAALTRDHGSDVDVFCSHDAVALLRRQAA